MKEKGFREDILIADWVRWTDELFDYTKFQRVPFVVCNYDMGGVSNEANEVLRIKEHRELLMKYAEFVSSYNSDFYIYNMIRILRTNPKLSIPLKFLIKIIEKIASCRACV